MALPPKDIYDHKIFRLLYILNKLNEQGSVKVSELAREFNVSKRTVQRDLSLLDIAGFPIIQENGMQKFDRGFSLTKITLKPEEKFLIVLFCNLFSKVGAPFDTTAKGFLDKVLFSMSGKKSLYQDIFNSKQKKVLSEEFGVLRNRLTARLEDLSCPPAFANKINEILDEMRIKFKKLNSERKANIEFKVLEKSYRSRKSIASIVVPKTYFNNPYQKLDHSTYTKYWVFSIYIDLPCKVFSSFRIGMGLDMYFKFFGPHIKGKKIECFDEFAEYLGFKKSCKRFEYEYSYGNDKDILITRGHITWEKVIPMPDKEIKALRNSTGGYIVCSKKKRER
ncbi:MAG: HTH domain-containing protein [Candidatus Omnitrophota bacterium]